MTKETSLRAHLRQARSTVDTWPDWKKQALGGRESSHHNLDRVRQADDGSSTAGRTEKERERTDNSPSSIMPG